jgi:hypothetical protein
VTTPQALELELKPLRYRAMHLKATAAEAAGRAIDFQLKAKQAGI